LRVALRQLRPRAIQHGARVRAYVVDDVLHPHHALEELDHEQVLHVGAGVGRERLDVVEVTAQRVFAAGAHARDARVVIDVQSVALDPRARVGHRDVGQPVQLGLAPLGVLLAQVAPCERLRQRGGQAADDPLLIHG
jgi:hypothetical protein